MRGALIANLSKPSRAAGVNEIPKLACESGLRRCLGFDETYRFCDRDVMVEANRSGLCPPWGYAPHEPLQPLGRTSFQELPRARELLSQRLRVPLLLSTIRHEGRGLRH